ncbi:MAG: YciI family protein [Corynebacterium sp.]|uniref:YciI family protein n=1 Tax=uncultured Corynebacterium sp. TaxID=159447 RepID=UPI0017E6BC36|nr:YciI family protein [uncultured Corynebacterium sp.]NLZ58302.1 YciI family protein [Corynebacterium sp.]
MTYFAVTYTYSPDSDIITDLRPTHREFISGLKDKGHIVGSGPFTDGDGGALIVLELEDGSTLADAEALINGDPFHSEGALENRSIRVWNPVIKSFGE